MHIWRWHRRLWLIGLALLSTAWAQTAQAANGGGTLMLQAAPSLIDQALALLANPNVAYLLLVLGLLGLIGEAISGGGVPGVAGFICLVLSLIGLGNLPTNWGGVVIILVAVALFLFDLKVPGHGLSIAALLIFLLGSFMLFTPPWETSSSGEAARLSPWVMLATTGAVGVFFILGVAAALRAQNAPVAVGKQTLIGKTGTVLRPLVPSGVIRVAGEEWTAVSAAGEPLAEGASVRVVGADGLTLRVEREPDAQAPGVQPHP